MQEVKIIMIYLRKIVLCYVYFIVKLQFNYTKNNYTLLAQTKGQILLGLNYMDFIKEILFCC